MNLNYKISMHYDDYIVHHDEIVAYNLTAESNSIVFNTTKETLNYLNINNINYVIESNYKEKLKKFLYLKKFILLGLILLIFCVYLNGYRVQNITFNIETPINDEIKERIEATNKKLFMLDFSTVDYQELSKDLRSEYPCYEWISISKNYDVIEVEIIKTGLNNQYSDEINGNIVASKDGVISSYLVHSGDIMVSKNDYVKQGDVLIQGGYYEKVVSPKGVILAHTFEEEVYTIDKVINTKELTGLSKSFYRISLFNNIFDLSKEKYNEYKEDSVEIFKIPFLFTLYKIIHYEKNDIIYTNDLESAKEYGFTKVEEKFNISKVIDEEMIETCLILQCEEFEDSYQITYLVKKLESIGKLEIV